MITHTGKLHRFLFPSMIWRMPGEKIFLTFDDGPHRVATPKVLNVCAEHNIRATFFLSGKNIEGNEEIIQRIAAEGHSIGIHAYNHSRRLAFSKAQTKDEIVRTQNILGTLTTQRIRLFRPPFGFFSWNTITAARELNFLLVMWSCLTGDFRTGSDDHVATTATTNLHKGSILVFHDNDKTENRIDIILRKTINTIRQRGFDFGAIR